MRLTTRSLLAVTVFVAPLLLGAQCSIMGIGSGQDDDLDDARRRWRAAGVEDYTFVLRRNCFCGGGVEPVRIVVRDGVAVSYTVVATGQPLNPEWQEWHPTVEGLFDFLEDALDRDADRIDVQYDGGRGYPISIFVDYEERTADEEMGYEVQSLQVDG
jgi:hypothetical protein